MIFEFGKSKVDIDVERTRAFYESEAASVIDCDCEGCQNYLKYCQRMPLQLRDFFTSMGVQPEKVCEIYTTEEGSRDVYYGGWFHVCGTVIQRSSEENQYHCLPKFDFYIEEENDYLLEEGFPEPVVQIGMEFCIPWLE